MAEYHEELNPPPPGCATGLDSQEVVVAIKDPANEREQIQARYIYLGYLHIHLHIYLHTYLPAQSVIFYLFDLWLILRCWVLKSLLDQTISRHSVVKVCVSDRTWQCYDCSVHLASQQGCDW